MAGGQGAPVLASREELVANQVFHPALPGPLCAGEAVAKMARIFRDVTREETRFLLRLTPSMSFSLGDRKGYKLARFRCAAPADDPDASPGKGPSPRDAGASVWRALAATCGLVYEGMLGCWQCLRGSALEDVAEDYGVRAAGEVVDMLHQFCAPMDGAEDTELFRESAGKVHAACADGALPKVAGIPRERIFGQVVIVQRDPAHMVRIACRESLLRNSRLEAQNDCLFEPSGVLRKVQYSDSR